MLIHFSLLLLEPNALGNFGSTSFLHAGPDPGLPLRRSPRPPFWLRVLIYFMAVSLGETQEGPPSVLRLRGIFVIAKNIFSVSMMIASTFVRSPTHGRFKSQWKGYRQPDLKIWLFSWIFWSLLSIYGWWPRITRRRLVKEVAPHLLRH
jgi:hypothetical protein